MLFCYYSYGGIVGYRVYITLHYCHAGCSISCWQCLCTSVHAVAAVAAVMRNRDIFRIMRRPFACLCFFFFSCSTSFFSWCCWVSRHRRHRTIRHVRTLVHAPSRYEYKFVPFRLSQCSAACPVVTYFCFVAYYPRVAPLLPSPVSLPAYSTADEFISASIYILRDDARSVVLILLLLLLLYAHTVLFCCCCWWCLG